MTFTGKIALFVLLCSTVSAAAHAPRAALRVNVVDQSGAPITEALVLIHPEPAGNRPGRHDKLTRLALNTATDTFRKDLPAGDYDIFVAASGFHPSCKKLHLRGGETNAIEMMLKIENAATIVTTPAYDFHDLSRPQP
ncbi:MAG TPA: carboxypeptidase-like regulatory domain-containing protein [Candidatus Baltobacteraceae bacterium]|jgi:hypothetical protein|nr:carboxypeptidase-like regulatory domain-containing protein [Candidatus Baltobacteraceae bacterium]